MHVFCISSRNQDKSKKKKKEPHPKARCSSSLSTDNSTYAGHQIARKRWLVLPKSCTHGTVPFRELGPSVEQPSFGMVPLEIINKMGHVDLWGNKPWFRAQCKKTAAFLLFITMLCAHLTPAHTCIHTLMHVHCFRADFLSQAMGNIQLVQSSKNQTLFFFFLRNH